MEFQAPELQGSEPLKSFQSADDLGKAYLDLHGKVSSGDVSIISEDLRGDPNISKFKNVNDIAKSYVEVSKLVGTIKHAPSKPGEYKFTQLKDVHPGLKVEPTQKFLAEQFHALDIDGERADKLQQAIVTALDKGLKGNDEARKAKGLVVETALRGEWKGDYEKNKDMVEKVLARAGGEEFAKGISGDPARLKAAHKIVSLLSEDSIGKLGDTGPANITDKTMAQNRLNEMIVNKEHLTKEGKWKTGPEYDKFTEEWQRLNQLAGS